MKQGLVEQDMCRNQQQRAGAKGSWMKAVKGTSFNYERNKDRGVMYNMIDIINTVVCYI